MFDDGFKAITFVEAAFLIEICASLNYRKKLKSEPSRKITPKLATNLGFLIVVDFGNDLFFLTC